MRDQTKYLNKKKKIVKAKIYFNNTKNNIGFFFIFNCFAFIFYLTYSGQPYFKIVCNQHALT